jgi:hypothetical protein
MIKNQRFGGHRKLPMKVFFITVMRQLYKISLQFDDIKYHQSIEGPLRCTRPEGHRAQYNYGDTVNCMNTLNTIKTFCA